MAKERNRIRDWKGLIADESRLSKLVIVLAMSLASASVSFVQLGFMYVELPGGEFGYAMALLVPIAISALLLGKGWGCLQGLISGVIVYAHAGFQPLDLCEKYFVSPANSIVLCSIMGFLLGLFFAMALKNDPKPLRRGVYFAIVSVFASLIASLGFFVFSFVNVLMQGIGDYMVEGGFSQNMLVLIASIGSFGIQWCADAVLVFAFSLIAHRLLDRYKALRAGVGVNVVFKTDFFVVVIVAFSVLWAVSYVYVTRDAELETNKELSEELDYLVGRLEDLEREHGNESMDNNENQAREALSGSTLIKGYTMEADGTVVVLVDSEIVLSNNPAFEVGEIATDVYGDSRAGYLKQLAQSGDMEQILYYVQGFDEETMESLKNVPSARELGYMKIRQDGPCYIMMAKPSSMVFQTRSATTSWIVISVLVILVAVYLLAANLLKRIVITPINMMNTSLAKITDGDLDERVNVPHATTEFDSLSEGINTTVTALKGWIGEAERRMKGDLATAKTIQESALPSTFPPFPEVDAFDIFASMNAAKEVGGDFYDFFLIDDHTLGFLIADVSGKGIPGALFMMAAKAELENFMQEGMELSQAVAGANERLCANNDAGMFVTVWAATLDYATGELTYVNAGHNFPLLRHGSGGEWEWLKKKCGLFLGTFDVAKYRQETLTLEPGDELLLYTDGVNEAFNVDEEEYGNDRLEAFLAAHNDLHAREMVRSLRADVASWAEGAEQSDDITILALEYGVAPEVTGSLTVSAVLDNLDAVIDLVNTELNKRLCPPVIRNKVEVALEELFVNVCRYAYADQEKPGEVSVEYIYTGDPSSITVQITDQGVPFDPITREDPTKPSNIQEAKIGGLGIYMVKKSMDDLSYIRDGNSNVVAFRKTW